MSLYRSNVSDIADVMSSKRSSHPQSRQKSAKSSRFSRRDKDAPPAVIPLYQLDKYAVKPSEELKKKRLRERKAMEDAQV